MYELIRRVLKIIFPLIFRCKIIGEENIPLHGGVIIAANHLSLWDPPILGSAISKRPIHFMAKEELFAIPVFGWIISKLNAFPVKRGIPDRTAIRTTIKLLENGEIVGIFPEGTRSKTGKIGAPEPGIAMFAYRTGVPIIPAAIIGTNKIIKRESLFPRITVVFGNPIFVTKGKADKVAMESLTDTFMKEISLLIDSFTFLENRNNM